MLPAASGSRWIPRKMAGSAMITIDPSRAAMNMEAVVLARATHLYRSSWLRGSSLLRGAGFSLVTEVWLPGVLDALGETLEQWRGRSQLADLLRREHGLQHLGQLFVPGVPLVLHGPLPGLGEGKQHAAPVLRIGVPGHQSPDLQPGQRGPHRLRADLLQLGQRAGRG